MWASQNSTNGQERRVVSRRDKTQWPAAKCNSLEADCSSSSVRTRAHVHLPESEGCPGCFAETAERPMAASQTLSDPSSTTSDRLRSQLETFMHAHAQTYVVWCSKAKMLPLKVRPGLKERVGRRRIMEDVSKSKRNDTQQLHCTYAYMYEVLAVISSLKNYSHGIGTEHLTPRRTQMPAPPVTSSVWPETNAARGDAKLWM